MSEPRVGRLNQLVSIIDDDVSVQRALGRLLKSVGVGSASYSTVRAYLRSGDLESGVCLLLDIHLSEMSGIELLKHVSEVAPKLPVICMTAREDPEVTQRLAVYKLPPCLCKPFGEAELFAALSKVAGISISGYG